MLECLRLQGRAVIDIRFVAGLGARERRHCNTTLMVRIIQTILIDDPQSQVLVQGLGELSIGQKRAIVRTIKVAWFAKERK